VYDTLSGVYAFLVPDALLTPEGSAAAFAWALDDQPPGAHVLDCACGTGQLAVGLALLGYSVTASDASAGMVARTRALAAEHGVELPVEQRLWEDLEPAGYDVVLCVGNSLVHAPGTAARRAALRAMAGALRPGGRLALTSRNWEALRERRPALEVDDRLVERDGARGLLIHRWHFADAWADEHAMEVAVALVGGDGTVETHQERLTFWPFTHEQLLADVAAAGLDVEFDGWRPAEARWALAAVLSGSAAPS
jgi:SAM-dependent methyltransferase